MQFFPNAISFGVSALGGVSLGKSAPNGVKGQNGPGQALAKANAFLESLNQELSALGMKPVVDANAVLSGPPVGFRTIKRDISATLDKGDITQVLEKLRKNGIPDAALTGIEGLLHADTEPTIGAIMGAVRGDGRETEDLTDEEVDELAGVFQKLNLTPEESDELLNLMREGRGHEALRILKAKAAEQGEGSFGLTGREALALARGLDLSPGALQKVANLFAGTTDNNGASKGATGEDPTRSLADLLGPITEDIATRRAEAEKIAAQFKDVITETLREKKSRERTEPVADTRGNGMTDRAERRMRDDLTAKGNGFGDGIEDKEDEKKETTVGKASLPDKQESGKDALAENMDLADDGDPHGDARNDARDDARRETPKEKTIPVAENSRDRSAEASEKAPSQARQEAAPMLDRMDVAPGTAAPAQNQTPVNQQNAATTYTRGQEIFSQVQQGMLRQLADGSRQMTLQLNPAELGQLTLVLSVKHGEVRALIRAENPEATAALAGQMDQLRATLEEQGLKVAQLDVETQLPDDTTREQWGESGMDQYNKEQEMREQARFARLAKLRAESGTTLAQDMQSKGMREENAASGEPGLHIIA